MLYLNVVIATFSSLIIQICTKSLCFNSQIISIFAPMYLIFHTAGVGKPLSWKARVDEVFNWPRLLHLSWIVLGKDLKPLEDYNCIIRPSGFEVTEEIAKNHSLELPDIEKGEDLNSVLDSFEASANKCRYIFSHNLKLNSSILGAEFIRADRKNPFSRIETYCIMQEGTFYCKLRGKRGGYKWPSLQEMHSLIFKQQYSPAYNARADVVAAARCFIALMKVGAFEDIFDEEEV